MFSQDTALFSNFDVFLMHFSGIHFYKVALQSRMVSYRFLPFIATAMNDILLVLNIEYHDISISYSSNECNSLVIIQVRGKAEGANDN